METLRTCHVSILLDFTSTLYVLVIHKLTYTNVICAYFMWKDRFYHNVEYHICTKLAVCLRVLGVSCHNLQCRIGQRHGRILLGMTSQCLCGMGCLKGMKETRLFRMSLWHEPRMRRFHDSLDLQHLFQQTVFSIQHLGYLTNDNISWHGDMSNRGPCLRNKGQAEATLACLDIIPHVKGEWSIGHVQLIIMQVSLAVFTLSCHHLEQPWQSNI